MESPEEDKKTSIHTQLMLHHEAHICLPWEEIFARKVLPTKTLEIAIPFGVCARTHHPPPRVTRSSITNTHRDASITGRRIYEQTWSRCIRCRHNGKGMLGPFVGGGRLVVPRISNRQRRAKFGNVSIAFACRESIGGREFHPVRLTALDGFPFQFIQAAHR